MLCKASCSVGPILSVCFYSRYMQDFNQLSGETNTESSTRALVHAVETCFVGKKFIFGVKVTFNPHYGLLVSFCSQFLL